MTAKTGFNSIIEKHDALADDFRKRRLEELRLRLDKDEKDTLGVTDCIGPARRIDLDKIHAAKSDIGRVWQTVGEHLKKAMGVK